MTNQLLRRTDLPVIGPWDLTPLHPVDQLRALSTDTDALSRAPTWNLDLRETLADRLKADGYRIVDYGQPTDLLVLNTCSVTGASVRISAGVKSGS